MTVSVHCRVNDEGSNLYVGSSHYLPRKSSNIRMLFLNPNNLKLRYFNPCPSVHIYPEIIE
jgi:hypothetical protein